MKSDSSGRGHPPSQQIRYHTRVLVSRHFIAIFHSFPRFLLGSFDIFVARFHLQLFLIFELLGFFCNILNLLRLFGWSTFNITQRDIVTSFQIVCLLSDTPCVRIFLGWYRQGFICQVLYCFLRFLLFRSWLWGFENDTVFFRDGRGILRAFPLRSPDILDILNYACLQESVTLLLVLQNKYLITPRVTA